MEMLLNRWENEVLENKEENTMTNYLVDVKYFLSYMKDKLNTDNEIEIVTKTTTRDIAEYLNYRKTHSLKKKKGVKDSSINRYVFGIKKYFKFAISQGYIEKNPVDSIETTPAKVLYKKRKEKNILTGDELKKFFAITYKRCKGDRDFEFNSIRNRLLFSILTEAGCRIEEVLQSELSWIVENSNGELFLCIDKDHVKNDINKRIPIIGKIKRYFDEYMCLREEMNMDSKYFILSHNGKPMNPGSTMRNLNKECKKAGIEKTLTNHSFRYIATNILRENMVDDDLILKIVGWTDGKDNSKRMLNRYSVYAKDNIYDKQIVEGCNFAQQYFI